MNPVAVKFFNWEQTFVRESNPLPIQGGWAHRTQNVLQALSRRMALPNNDWTRSDDDFQKSTRPDPNLKTGSHNASDLISAICTHKSFDLDLQNTAGWSVRAIVGNMRCMEDLRSLIEILCRKEEEMLSSVATVVMMTMISTVTAASIQTHSAAAATECRTEMHLY